MPQVAQQAAKGGQNPSMAQPAGPGNGPNAQQWGVTEEDLQTLQSIVSDLRGGWMQDRMERIRVWMLNVMMEKGIQWVGWDQSSQCWFDALAEFRSNGLEEDGESVELEKWMNNITLMFKQIFVGNLTRAIPHSVVRPENAEKPVDVQTAKASQDVLEILDRKNNVRSLTRGIYETLFTFGSYFRYTRPVVDGTENGYDLEAVFEDIEVQMPARMQCPRCGQSTAMSELPMPQPGMLPNCPGCSAPLGPESYHAAGEGNRLSIRKAGVQKVPRAGVRMTIHTPLEVDVDPNAKIWWQSPVLAFDREISYGEALQLFPNFRDRIQQGAAAETTPNADWEKLMRTQEKSVTSGYASDLQMRRPTYSQNWLQTAAFWEKNDAAFAQRMEAAFPDGCELDMVGGVVVDLRPACMRRNWSSGRLYEGYGPYCPSLAERIVPFNQRFNAAMQVIDEALQRTPTGLNVMDAARLDPQKVRQRTLVPGHVFEVPMRINGEQRPLAETFMHWDLPLNPQMLSYPTMLLTFCQLIAHMPPQVAGQGTQPGIETGMGQEQALGQANEALEPYWQNVKDECAEAAYNEIHWVKELMKVGALKKVWRVEETRGAGFRNQSVSWDKMEGDIEVFADEDQDLPTSPAELRNSFMLLFKELSAGNPAAKEFFEVPANVEMVLNTMLPGAVSPVEAQITKTQVDIQILLQQPAKLEANPDGSSRIKLPVEPDKNFEDFTTAKACVRNFAMENADLRFSDPDAWERLNMYLDQLEEMDAQVGAEQAQRQMMVNKAGMPPAPPEAGPPPEAMAAVQELLRKAVAAVDGLMAQGAVPAAQTGGTLTAQVSALSEVVDSAVSAGKELRLASQGKK